MSYDLELPIPVLLPGSTVEYSFDTVNSDISFGVFLRRSVNPAANAAVDTGADSKVGGNIPLAVPTQSFQNRPSEQAAEQQTEEELLPTSRVDSHLSKVSGSFKVIHAPCVAVLAWDNHYSWFSSKELSYAVTVKPPPENVVRSLHQGKVKEALGNARADLRGAKGKMDNVKANRLALSDRVKQLEAELLEINRRLDAKLKEESYLAGRVNFRTMQIKGLEERINQHSSLRSEI